jgi:hypothetical protein
MIAYNRETLDNRHIQQQAKEALAKKIITEAEYQRIREAYPYKLYSPNIFIRFGLFLLTVLIVTGALGIFMLATEVRHDLNIGIVLIVWGIAAYGALEFFIHNRRQYQSGIDDALLWMAGILVFGGINWALQENLTDILESTIVLILATWGVLRYADRLMALVAYCALIDLIFHLLIPRVPFGRDILPFLVMAVSAITWFCCMRLEKAESLRHYHSCLGMLRQATLLGFYLSGNYYIVQNINAYISGGSAPVKWSWLWWAFTFAVPVIYLVSGIRKKDRVLLCTGLVLIAAAILTFRYYHHILSVEAAMTVAGGILLVVAYCLVRYLRIPKNGFTSDAPDEPHPLKDLPIETLLIAETFKSIPAQPSDQSARFGGGSGGGAGAGGTY